MSSLKNASESRFTKDRPRKPLSNNGGKYSISDDFLDKANFHYRFVDMDNPSYSNDRVTMFEEAGYSTVKESELKGKTQLEINEPEGGSLVKRTTGGITSVLMKVPKAYFLEDQATNKSKREAVLKNQGLSPTALEPTSLSRISVSGQEPDLSK